MVSLNHVRSRRRLPGHCRADFGGRKKVSSREKACGGADTSCVQHPTAYGNEGRILWQVPQENDYEIVRIQEDLTFPTANFHSEFVNY